MTDSAWNHDDVLQQMRQWLDRTAREVDAFGAAPRWEAQPGSEQLAGAGSAPSAPRWAAPVPAVGLLQVVEALTAMRQELKLQTKSGRALEESVESARTSLDAAMRQFQSVQAREEESARRAALPLIEILTGLDESLERGAKACATTYRQLAEWAPRQIAGALDDQFQKLRWWQRWRWRSWHTRVLAYVSAEMVRTAHEEFAQLLDGYRLIQDRVTRELERSGVSRVATVGERVDPRCMTVVEVADASEGPPETVVQELRPGYWWQNTVVRYAEVRAVRALTQGTEQSTVAEADARSFPIHRSES